MISFKLQMNYYSILDHNKSGRSKRRAKTEHHVYVEENHALSNTARDFPA